MPGSVPEATPKERVQYRGLRRNGAPSRSALLADELFSKNETKHPLFPPSTPLSRHRRPREGRSPLSRRTIFTPSGLAAKPSENDSRTKL